MRIRYNLDLLVIPCGGVISGARACSVPCGKATGGAGKTGADQSGSTPPCTASGKM